MLSRAFTILRGRGLSIASKLAAASMLFGLGLGFAHKQCWPLGNGCFFPRGAGPELREYARNKYWAEKLREGGYILHFRHAEREKWADVSAFDALEAATGVDGEQTTYRRAVCLTERGKEEAKLIGESFKLTGVRVGEIVASPSCRARQTASLAFGRIDLTRNSLLQRVAIMKDQHKQFAQDLKRLMLRSQPKPGANVALVGHGGTLAVDRIVDINETGHDLDWREETGFVVLEARDGKLIARHTFRSIRFFVTAAVPLPFDKDELASGM